MAELDVLGVIYVLPSLLFGWKHLLDPKHIPSPSKSHLEARFRQGIEPSLPNLDPPEADIATGLAFLMLTMWMVLTLQTRTVDTAADFSQPFLFVLGLIVCWIEPSKRSILAPALYWFTFKMLVEIYHIRQQITETGSSDWSRRRWRPITNLPIITKLWAILLLTAGIYMMLKSSSKPIPIFAHELSNGEIEFHPPLSTDSRGGIYIDPSFLGYGAANRYTSLVTNPSFTIVAYGSPLGLDFTKTGFCLVYMALIIIFTSSAPKLESSALAASVPLSILAGAMILFMKCWSIKWGNAVLGQGWMITAGIISTVYGILLGFALDNYSGRPPPQTPQVPQAPLPQAPLPQAPLQPDPLPPPPAPRVNLSPASAPRVSLPPPPAPQANPPQPRPPQVSSLPVGPQPAPPPRVSPPKAPPQRGPLPAQPPLSPIGRLISAPLL